MKLKEIIQAELKKEHDIEMEIEVEKDRYFVSINDGELLIEPYFESDGETPYMSNDDFDLVINDWDDDDIKEFEDWDWPDGDAKIIDINGDYIG